MHGNLYSTNVRTEDAVIEMIRQRGIVGRAKYAATMDRSDLTPSEWMQHHQEELVDALLYSERLKGAAQLLDNAHDLISKIMQDLDREWEQRLDAAEWMARHNAHFAQKIMQESN